MNFNNICISSKNTILASNTATSHQHQKSLLHAQLPQKNRTSAGTVSYTHLTLPTNSLV